MPVPQPFRQSIQRQSRHLLTTGRRFTSFDQIRQRHFWSTAMFIADSDGYILGSQQLFITPAGQNGQGFPSGVALTERETNWKSANRVPDNQNFEITELGVTPTITLNSILPGAINDMQPPTVAASFLQNTVLSITYLTNSVPLGMATDFAQASGPYGGSFAPENDALGTVVNPVVETNGFPAPALRRRFKIPILLQHGETFSFELALPRAVFIGAAGNAITARMDFWATESFAEKS